MPHAWAPLHVVDPPLARALIERQFPALAPIRLASAGEGWDNTAYLVNETYIFRFPRREIAVPLLEAEVRVLRALAARVPLPVPLPIFVGRPEAGYPWSFAGYARLPGRPAPEASLGDGPRGAAAATLGGFLAALHAIPAADARAMGAPLVPAWRVDLVDRVARIRRDLDALGRHRLIEDARAWDDVLDAAAEARAGAPRTLVHGDLYAAHVLVDEAGRPTGIIDWGDVHVGDVAVDLSLAHGFLPPAARSAFLRAYGAVDEATWHLARFWALHAAVVVLLYAHETSCCAKPARHWGTSRPPSSPAAGQRGRAPPTNPEPAPRPNPARRRSREVPDADRRRSEAGVAGPFPGSGG
ncbi:MAG: phosphotransferase [Planctomycetota bacterium]|jgi:aminoglycoside phosphotransferase (APT) family kinase protein